MSIVHFLRAIACRSHWDSPFPVSEGLLLALPSNATERQRQQLLDKYNRRQLQTKLSRSVSEGGASWERCDVEITVLVRRDDGDDGGGGVTGDGVTGG